MTNSKIAQLEDLTPVDRYRYLESLTIPHTQPECLIGWLNPWSSLGVYTKGDRDQKSELKNLMALHLCALQAFDDAANEVLFNNKCHIYLYGDATVCAVIQEVLKKTDDGVSLLEGLNFLGLIYRFHTATKFCSPKPNLKQLRINGWGRHLFTLEKLNESNSYKELYNYFLHYIFENKSIYMEITNLCNEHSRPLRTTEIWQLNDRLTIPIVT